MEKATQGKKIKLMFRLTRERKTTAAKLLALEISHEYKSETKTDTQSTKDGNVPTSGMPSASIEMEFLRTGTETYNMLKYAYRNGLEIDVWRINFDKKDPKTGKYEAEFGTGLLDSFGDSAESDSNSSIKPTLVLNGDLVLRRVDNTNYLDYISNYGDDSDTPLQLTKNLKSATRDIDISELFTRIVPVGQDIEDNSETDIEVGTDYSRPKYTIESVNNYKNYLDDPSLIEKFGLNTGIVEFPNVKEPSILKRRGQQWLKDQSLMLVTWDVEAIELTQISHKQKRQQSMQEKKQVKRQNQRSKLVIQLR